MNDLFAFPFQSRCARVRRHRSRGLRVLAMAALLFAVTVCAHGQAGTQFHDLSALKPPPGARVAIVEFEDMECPACAGENPALMQAVAKYKISWVCHDLIIPFHTWSPRAAINAHWFSSKSEALGHEYRDAVFANQPYIYNLMMLDQFTDSFAASHSVKLPFSMDPQNKLFAEVQADTDLGKRIGVERTPTIFIVTSSAKGSTATEVPYPWHDLDRMIEQALTAPRR
jgi:protein-disulfide isomerase